MKLTTSISLLASVSVATATKSSRTLSSGGAEFSSQTYDYIIVGGGTGGIALAARLSEDPNVSVGVVEAGEYLVNDALIDTPGMAGQSIGNPKYDWMLQSIPQAHLNDRAVFLPRGKGVGGSSMINFMVLDRASKSEYDTWAALGNKGWDWNGLLPCMEAAENFAGINLFRAKPSKRFPSQGTKGPIAASYNTWYSDLVVPYGKAMANLSVPANFDPDSGNAFGTYNSVTAVNRETGKRSYAGNTYYAYNAHRSNFVVLTGAQATKIEFKNSTSGGRSSRLIATGVSFVHNSATFSVKAKREVIISAGTYKTPQLLELSGIGNSTILRQFGITPLVDLPGVGGNLQDHPFVPTTYELKPGSSLLNFDMLRINATFAAAAQAQYTSTHDGALAATSTIISFINLDYLAGPAKIANMTSELDREIALDTRSITPLQKAQYTIQKNWLNRKIGHVEVILNPGYFAFGTPKANTSYISLLMALQHPFARGSVHINSSDPMSAPRINPNYFSKSFDQETLVQAIKFGLTMSKTEPLASMIVARQDPAPEVLSDAEITDYVKANANSIHHPIGTAVMAPKVHGGVVDTSLKVYGTSNVRVVDASIIPIHISAHLASTVYGIAEKAASIIKNGRVAGSCKA